MCVEGQKMLNRSTSGAEKLKFLHCYFRLGAKSCLNREMSIAPNLGKNLKRTWNKVLPSAKLLDNKLKTGGADYQTSAILLMHGDALESLRRLEKECVDCVVTSPPYYGQRDYGVSGQVGLESDPLHYVNRLVQVMDEVKRVLKKSGSLWINLGDTYWSGKGAPHQSDSKNKHRRFARPQDKRGPHQWCRSKQLMLLPHRIAIAMQDHGWLLRNDNIWHKISPTPDPVKDRSAAAHEYMFHFVISKRYYYNFPAVAKPCKGDPKSVKPVSSVWTLQNKPNFKKHAAVFPAELVTTPILSTLPLRGTILDPFCGSGTALETALVLRPKAKAIGIDLSSNAISEAAERLGLHERAESSTVKVHHQNRSRTIRPTERECRNQVCRKS